MRYLKRTVVAIVIMFGVLIVGLKIQSYVWKPNKTALQDFPMDVILEVVNDPGLMVHPDSIGMTDESKRILAAYFDSVMADLSYIDTIDQIQFLEVGPLEIQARIGTNNILIIYDPQITVVWDTLKNGR